MSILFLFYAFILYLLIYSKLHFFIFIFSQYLSQLFYFDNVVTLVLINHLSEFCNFVILID